MKQMSVVEISQVSGGNYVCVCAPRHLSYFDSVLVAASNKAECREICCNTGLWNVYSYGSQQDLMPYFRKCPVSQEKDEVKDEVRYVGLDEFGFSS